MSLVPVDFVGQTGLIKDKEPYDLGPEFFTDSRNVRYELGEVSRAPTWRRILEIVGIPPLPQAYGLFFAHSLTTRYWVYTSTAKVKAIDGLTPSDITRVASDYTGNATDFWNGGMFNDILILNNGVDVPQMWNFPASATVLADLTNWPATVRAKVVRPFKNWLIALNVTKAGVHDDRLVKWSNTTAPLVVPNSWDETDSAKDAGEVSLAEGEDSIVDGLSVGNVFLIGTESETWTMRYVGGQNIFAFDRALDSVGLLTQGCAVSFLNRIFQVTADDLILHNFSDVQSASPAHIKNWFFRQLTQSNAQYVRAIRKVSAREVWVCFPYGGANYLNTALVWNWQFNTWAIRDIPSNLAIASGISKPTTTGATWDTISGSWDSQTKTWDEGSYAVASDRIAVMSDQLVLWENGIDTNTTDGTPAYLERVGLGVKASEGKAIINHEQVAVMREIWPKFVADDGVQFSIKVGFQMFRKAPITWQAPQTFTVGVDQKLGFFGSYRYLALRIDQVTPRVPWKLVGFDLDIEMTGVL